MPAGFIQTENIDLAAAFRVLGFPLKTDKCEEAISGQGWVKILIGAQNVPTNAFCPIGTLSASVLRKALQNAQEPLWKVDPHHPLVDALAVYQNAQSLKDAMLKGVSLRLDDHQILQPGHEDARVVHCPSMIQTGDYRLVAALSRLGFRLARIEGTSPACKLLIADPAQEGATLVRLFRESNLDERNPLHVRLGFLMIALEVRDRVRDYVTKRENRILLINPKRRFAVNPLLSPSALIPASADNKTLDAVQRHLRIG